MNITDALRPVFRNREKEIALYKDREEAIQKKVLASLLSAAKNTEIGTKYKFNEITADYKGFASRVPVIDYEGVKPYVERMLKGEQNLIWPSKIKWFAKSSGTTNDKSKYIPVSDEARKECHYKGGRDCVALYLGMNPKSNFFSGKGLILGGSHSISQLEGHYHCGDLSAVLIQNIPTLVNMIRIPSKEIALMSEWESKLEMICRTSINENVTNLSGVPSWFLVLIKQILQKTGKQCLNEVWPNLEVFFHGGISFEPYRQQYRELIVSPKMHYVETYNASEGFFAVQNDLDDRAMLLLIDLGIFFEFIPIDEADGDNPTVLPYWEVEKGKTYALVITTNSGLWRYKIGDTVKEELMVDNAEKGIATACRETGAEVTNYSAAPVFMSGKERGRHQWLIEFGKMPDSIDNFADKLDAALQSLNSDYEAKRYKGIALDRPEVIAARKGVFEEWLRRKGKLGGQHKIPRLSNSREYIEEMLKINNE